MSCQNVHLERLRSSRDFQEVYRAGRKCTGRYFILFVRPREDETIYFGVTATRRLGNAVCRNRAKRIMREAIRQLVADVIPGFDMVLVARSDIRSARTPQITAQLGKSLLQCHRIKKPERSISS